MVSRANLASDPATSEARLCALGRQRYEQVWRAMQSLTDQRDASTPDELWVLEHDAVFTQGQAGRPEHLLAPGDIPVVQVDRGGQVTYHGPGQLVVYPLLDLRRLGLGVRALVDKLEEAVIRTLAELDIDAARREGAPGVYVEDRKIAQLGLRVRRGCSFHGLAFNVNMDLEPFSRINPCGFAGLEVTQVADFHADITVNDVSSALIPQMADALGLRLIQSTKGAFENTRET